MAAAGGEGEGVPAPEPARRGERGGVGCGRGLPTLCAYDYQHAFQSQLVSDLGTGSSPQTCMTMAGYYHLPPMTGLYSQTAETLACLCQSNAVNPAQQSLSRKCLCICLP